jgi:hypothetical protein
MSGSFTMKRRPAPDFFFNGAKQKDSAPLFWGAHQQIC